MHSQLRQKRWYGGKDMLFYKNLILQILKNKVFVFLLWILTLLTSLSYFFVQFSIDGNMDLICAKDVLSENEVLWKEALLSNTSLAYIFLISTTALTGFVFFMFFYRFIRSKKVQLGCVKALGMKDRELLFSFEGFVILLSFLGEIPGVIIGYFLSDVLTQAYGKSYGVTGIVKGIHASSVLEGMGLPILFYGIVTFFCFFMVKGREPGVLMAGRVAYKKLGVSFHAADRIAGWIPVKEKFPFRIALRKPVSILLMLFAILFFEVCVILGQSLNVSSQKRMQSQMQGHDYAYDVRLNAVKDETVKEGEIPYLYQEGEVIVGKGEKISQTMIGLMKESDLFAPENGKGVRKGIPIAGTVYINEGLSDMYGIDTGDELIFFVNGTEKSFQVTDILKNAQFESIYCNAEDLALLMGTQAGCFNGIWSMERTMYDGETESREQRMERLERDAVSNRLSAVINQVTGVVIGMILLFLALFLNFQDNQRDMEILRLIGYKNGEIRKLFVDIYWPITIIFFVLGSVPALFLAKMIQRGLSLAIHDYMPFGTNIGVFVLMFLMLNLLYGCVWSIFTGKLKTAGLS